MIIIKEFVWIDIIFLLNLAFWQVAENIKAKTAVKFEVQVKFEGLCQSTYLNFIANPNEEFKWYLLVCSEHIHQFHNKVHMMKFKVRIWSTTFIEVSDQDLKHNFHDDKQYKTQKIHSAIQVFALGGRILWQPLNTVKSRFERKLLTDSVRTDDMSTFKKIVLLLVIADSNCNG